MIGNSGSGVYFISTYTPVGTSVRGCDRLNVKYSFIVNVYISKTCLEYLYLVIYSFSHLY